MGTVPMRNIGNVLEGRLHIEYTPQHMNHKLGL
jgi:hypothetical protein